ncbi:MAG: glycosyltransferase family 92 protein [Leadbetterella sp.]|nr:glycosyltransferase family 92 protein [Leadbetterella sp.]
MTVKCRWGEVLSDFKDICTIIPVRGEKQQVTAYNHFVKNFAKETEWVAVFDVDEFVLTRLHATLRDFVLDRGRNADCIGINWVVFGNRPHIRKPASGGVIGNYLYSEGRQHKNVKCVVRARAIRKFKHPHYPELKWFKKHVNAAGNPMSGAENTEETTHIIQLNHYFTKSLEEYELKLGSRRSDTGEIRLENARDMEWMRGEPERCSVYFDDALWEKFRVQLPALHGTVKI